MPHRLIVAPKRAIYVLCADGAWSQASEAIADELLGITAPHERYRLQVAGPIVEIAMPERPLGPLLLDELAFLVGLGHVSTIVAYAHSRCGKVAELRGGHFDDLGKEHRYSADLLRVAVPRIAERCRNVNGTLTVRGIYVHDNNGDGFIEKDEISVIM
ncbi:MAG: hypothetical protein HY459_02650 [Parcubacteria group bacterium]|nr:hypothetical protein [Parcubacteria group bacterium]